MSSSPRNTILRQTYSASTKKLLMENSVSNNLDQDDTLKNRYSPTRNSPKRQSPDLNRLRSTYSPVTFSTKYLGEVPKMESPTMQSWKSAARMTGLSPPNLARRSSEVMAAEKGLSKIESQLDTLEQRVNKAIKELSSKNSRKQSKDIKIIREDEDNEYFTRESNLQRTRKYPEDNLQRKRSTKNLNPPSDLKATLKIPDLSKLVTTIPKPKDAVSFTTNPYSPRNHNIYYVSQLVRAIEEKNSLAKEHVRSSIKILKNLQNVEIPSFTSMEHKRMNLEKSPFYKDKKTLVFDLDETLIHCNENSDMPSDIKLSIKLQSGETFEAGINIRPYALQLLNNLVPKFQLILFTASHSSYANVVLDFLDPDRKIFQHRLFRQHCYYTETGVYVKDLRIINRNSSEIALIDNAAYSYAFQLQNGIPILSYYEGQDFQLKALQKYLDKFLFVKDMREVNKQTFKLHHYTKFNTPEQLIEQLYLLN